MRCRVGVGGAHPLGPHGRPAGATVPPAAAAANLPTCARAAQEGGRQRDCPADCVPVTQADLFRVSIIFSSCVSDALTTRPLLLFPEHQMKQLGPSCSLTRGPASRSRSLCPLRRPPPCTEGRGVRLSASHLSRSADPATMHKQASQAPRLRLRLLRPWRECLRASDHVRRRPSAADAPGFLSHRAPPENRLSAQSWTSRPGRAETHARRLLPPGVCFRRVAAGDDPSSGQEQQNTQLPLNSQRGVTSAGGRPAPATAVPTPPDSVTASSQSRRDTDLEALITEFQLSSFDAFY